MSDQTNDSTPRPAPLDYEKPETRRGEQKVPLSPTARAFRWSSGLTVATGDAAGLTDFEPLFIVAAAFCLAAFITAFLSVQECARRKGQGLLRLVPAILVLSAFPAAWSAFPAFRRPIEMANRTKCAWNLRALGEVMQLHCGENKGRFPDRWEELIISTNTGHEVMLCPSSNETSPGGDDWQQALASFSTGGHCSYVYLANGMKIRSVNRMTVLAYEPLKNHKGRGMNVLFGDGRVIFVEKTHARKMLDELTAGYNPPRAEKIK